MDKNKNIIVMVSGGKDSTCSLLLAMEYVDRKNIIPIFNDTGWEHPETYKYLDYLEKELGISIHRVETNGLVSLIRKTGKFPWQGGRFCTKALKTRALANYYYANIYDVNKRYELWFGMREDESSQRQRKYGGILFEDLFDPEELFVGVWNIKAKKTLEIRLPIVDWTAEEVFWYIKEKGIKHNPLYNEGTNDRVGCYPCMLASKCTQEKMFATEEGQKRLKIIKQLEVEIGKKYQMFDTDQGSCKVCNI